MKIKENLDSLEKKIYDIDINKMNSSIFEEHDRMNREIIKKIQENLDFKENKIGCLERFVEFYIPITIQSQLSETLSVILSR